MIKIENIKKTYVSEGVKCEAIKGVSFEIPDGQFISIVGRSGSGKSTLMHILGGIDSPDSGDVFFNELCITKMSNNELSKYRNKNTGFVFQAYHLEPSYTVYQNVEMPLVISGIKKEDRAKIVEEKLNEVGMLYKSKVKVSKLSGGEKQRASIARALVNSPSIILADEPCGNLDVENSNKIMNILKELSMKNIIVVLVTHNLNDSKFTDRTITILDGVVVSDEINR